MEGEVGDGERQGMARSLVARQRRDERVPANYISGMVKEREMDSPDQFFIRQSSATRLALTLLLHTRRHQRIEQVVFGGKLAILDLFTPRLDHVVHIRPELAIGEADSLDSAEGRDVSHCTKRDDECALWNRELVHKLRRGQHRFTSPASNSPWASQATKRCSRIPRRSLRQTTFRVRALLTLWDLVSS